MPQSSDDTTRMSRMLRAEPPRLSELLERAAGATQRSAPNRKRWASALRTGPRPLSRQTTSRHFTGDRHTPGARILLTLEQLATGEGTTPWPLILEGIATVLQTDIRKADEAGLRARLRELTDDEHTRQADEDRATVHAAVNADDPVALERAALADIREGAIQVERGAILRELAYRARRKRP